MKKINSRQKIKIKKLKKMPCYQGKGMGCPVALLADFASKITSTSGRLHSEFIRLLFLQTHWETDRFFATSGVQLAQCNSGLFHFLRVVFSPNLKSKSTVPSVSLYLYTLRINLNIDGVPITSKTHTHPSHSQTSRQLTSSLSLGVPVPRTTQCM